ncbi:ribosome maturation factor RimM [Aquabacterium sp. OR-4]|uniref:ribosome maturation factor RimM n=1 Tax=Aquabacterium sp. OR-4 TaxID=2978127 RepID=UPI0028C7EB77|nr:ribosome maturation factor RimM [Aquabacterium sp. OR-4]MDT7836794.1 ribosome maturation factor RimM [Aquabacterium sp. OR-4]
MSAAQPFAGADEPAFPEDAIEVGRVLGAWGVKGWIRVQPFSRDPKALFSSRRWFVRPPEADGPRPALPQGAPAMPPLLRITHSKEHGDGVVAAAQELGDRSAAEAMRGARIFIARSSFPTAGDGEYYWIDLIGLAVVNRDGAALGTVVDLLDTGAHSVLRIRRPEATEATPPAEAERLIPFVGAFIDDVSLAERRITVDWGLDF